MSVEGKNQSPIAEPSYAWTITMLAGRKGKRWIYIHGLKSTRADAIRDHVKACGKPWKELRKQGDRCVKVLVTEARDR